jgi:uncharacterized surface protein with fasciclin (FAS1) repeats
MERSDMKKTFVLLFTVIAALALAITPAFGQDDPGTIADIVVASASAETPEFATLLAAVSAADPAVLEALSNPEASLTVFAPTDAAFAALAEALGADAFAAVLADPAALTDILLFHVVEGNVMAADVAGLFSDTVTRASVPSLNGQYIDLTLDMGNIYVNGANLIATDVMASNGVIHVIDAVILPETRTIAELVVELAGSEAPEFSTLLAAVSAADPAVLEALSNPDAELTVFAPTDAAFAALAEALGEEAFNGVLADTAALSNILLYHVVPGLVYSSDLVAELTMGAMEGMEQPAWLASYNEDGSISVTTAAGATATISVREEGVFINDAQIVLTDVDAVNGVIHVISAVILPPSE